MRLVDWKIGASLDNADGMDARLDGIRLDSLNSPEVTSQEDPQWLSNPHKLAETRTCAYYAYIEHFFSPTHIC